MVVPFLREYCPICIGRGVGFDVEGFVGVHVDEDGGSGNEVLEVLEGLLLGGFPFPPLVYPGEVMERSGYFCEVLYESLVEVAESDEFLYSLDILGGGANCEWPVS
jgi:hypothetical protein